MAENIKRSHSLNISKKITITGVVNVECFDEKKVHLELSECLLTLEGNDFLIDNLSLDDGVVALTGKVDMVKYGKTREKGSFIKKLFK